MKRIFTCMMLSLAVAGTVRAQQQKDTAEHTTLETRIETLEKRTSTWERIAARLPKFSGYVQTGYRWADDESSFLLKRVRLTLAGDITPKIDYRVQFEFTKPQLVDAFIQYKPLKELNIKIGQYKVPFSIENTDYGPTRLELIEYPMVLYRMMGFGEDLCGISATGRDLGLTLWGGLLRRDGYSILNYDIGLFNGAGINCKDDNRSKDIAARLMIRPIKGLAISGSYYWGEAGSDYTKRERYAVGVCYDEVRFVVRSEWIGGKTGVKEKRYKSDGWYAMAAWRAPRNFMPVARFETFTRDHDCWSATTQHNYTLGLLWAPIKYLRCQLDYTREEYKAAGRSGRNVVSLMLTGMF